jgi:hypothetical protein
MTACHRLAFSASGEHCCLSVRSSSPELWLAQGHQSRLAGRNRCEEKCAAVNRHSPS